MIKTTIIVIVCPQYLVPSSFAVEIVNMSQIIPFCGDLTLVIKEVTINNTGDKSLKRGFGDIAGKLTAQRAASMWGEEGMLDGFAWTLLCRNRICSPVDLSI